MHLLLPPAAEAATHKRTHTHANTQAHTDTDTDTHSVLLYHSALYLLHLLSGICLRLSSFPHIHHSRLLLSFSEGSVSFLCCIRHCSDTSLFLSSQAPEARRESPERGVTRALPALPDPQHQPAPAYPNRTTVRPVKTLTHWTTAHTVASNHCKGYVFKVEFDIEHLT